MGITISSVLQAPLEETFAWHERPGAIERLMPPFQPVRVVTEAPSLSGGRAVLRLPGGLRAVAAHEAYDAPHRFVDHLVAPPFPWRHTHCFDRASSGSTLLTDVVDTPLPERLLRPTFIYRHHQLADDLATQQAMSALAPTPLSVGVTGASGLIGRALCSLLTTGGHRVVRLVRRAPTGPDERHWQPVVPAPSTFEDLDAVVHLAGASIAGRFSEAHKRAIRDSRIGPTEGLSTAVAKARHGPSVLVCASAIGVYGADRGDDVLSESSPGGGGFLAEVVSGWERATSAAEDAGLRVVHVRTGIVQSPQGGALRLLRRLFETGAGGRVGSGEQWFSWIDLDDATDVYFRALLDARCRGPINAVSPAPVTNEEYTTTLARVLRRPALVPVPVAGPQLLYGREGAQELVLASQRVRPTVLSSLGHSFRRPTLESCLRHQLGRDLR